MYPSSVQNAFYGIREYVTPVLKKSNVLQTGILTPEEVLTRLFIFSTLRSPVDL